MKQIHFYLVHLGRAQKHILRKKFFLKKLKKRFLSCFLGVFSQACRILFTQLHSHILLYNIQTCYISINSDQTTHIYTTYTIIDIRRPRGDYKHTIHIAPCDLLTFSYEITIANYYFPRKIFCKNCHNVIKDFRVLAFKFSFSEFSS